MREKQYLHLSLKKSLEVIDKIHDSKFVGLVLVSCGAIIMGFIIMGVELPVSWDYRESKIYNAVNHEEQVFESFETGSWITSGKSFFIFGMMLSTFGILTLLRYKISIIFAVWCILHLGCVFPWETYSHGILFYIRFFGTIISCMIYLLFATFHPFFRSWFRH